MFRRSLICLFCALFSQNFTPIYSSLCYYKSVFNFWIFSDFATAENHSFYSWKILYSFYIAIHGRRRGHGTQQAELLVHFEFETSILKRMIEYDWTLSIVHDKQHATISMAWVLLFMACISKFFQWDAKLDFLLLHTVYFSLMVSFPQEDMFRYVNWYLIKIQIKWL